jgi:hypothetical protein
MDRSGGVMKPGKALLIISFILAFAFFIGEASPADGYVRLRSVEGEVSIYPSDGQRTSEATINTPLMDGDEIQTGNGRAELSFSNGITIRLGDYSALRLESSYSPMRIDLVQGTAFVDSHLIDRFGDELVLRAGEAEVILIDEGNIRVDLGSEGSVRVTTIEGQAEVSASGRRVLVDAGERTYVDPGKGPDQPERIAGGTDELDDWNESRMDSYARNDFGGGYENYVDEDIYYDAYDLGGYGDWRYSGSYGNVWVPHVDDGWRPYYDGRWTYSRGGWFWVSYEPWGWAPYHYGRWGWSLDFGWYWIPGNVFAPAWVSWYSYGDYVGWCPLNYYGYPNYYYNNHYYPRVFKGKTLDASNSWTFVKKDDLGVRNIKKAVLDSAKVRQIKIERDKVSSTPKKELVSYVLPKTGKVPALVNDKRLIKEPGDIKSPIGVKNREEQFERKLKGGQATTKKETPSKSKTVERTFDKPGREPVKVQPNKSQVPQKTERSKPQIPQKKEVKPQTNNDRDWQFKRNESANAPRSPYSNPYYSDRYKRDRESYSSSPWSRKPSNDKYQRPADVNPKYRDEAKKYFERFDHKSQSDADRYVPRTYEPPSRNYEAPKRNYEAPNRSYEAPKRSYEAPKRSYEAPKRSYEAPKRSYEAPKRSYEAPKSNRSNQNSNSNRSKPSSSSNNNKKPRN